MANQVRSRWKSQRQAENDPFLDESDDEQPSVNPSDPGRFETPKVKPTTCPINTDLPYLVLIVCFLENTV